MSSIKFTKMQGLGNDFVILENEEYKRTNMDISILSKKLCDRKFGIGADGLIVVSNEVTDTDTAWYFYNSDGSEAQMCGNGMRCFARYMYDKKYIDKKKFSVQTKAGVIIPEIVSENEVRVDMNKPILEALKIPYGGKNVLNQDLIIEDKKFNINAVSMGNPHCIIFVDKNSSDLAMTYGPKIEISNLFPEKTNVEFVEIHAKDEITVNVWERGCGITLACGTGACACVVAGILNNLLERKVKVHLPGGDLLIEWSGDKENSVFMTGSAEYSFTGEYINL